MLHDAVRSLHGHLRQHAGNMLLPCCQSPLHANHCFLYYPWPQGGAAVDDMKQKAGQLQAQLRGLISDYQVGRGGGDSCLLLVHLLLVKLAAWLAVGSWGTVAVVAAVCANVSIGMAAFCRLPAHHIPSPLPSNAPAPQGGDEAIFAKAFEAFDMLSRCLEEQNAPQQQELPPAAAAVAGTGAPAGLAPPPAAAAAPVASRPPAEEPPLISFD